ncbi:hypothetical protein V8G54_024543 [Vigna mungo]|uniref:Uncharacterized protein n=1 Tax=Vigna mungo TaxID=3915 RepID=A0AAQ3RRE4_VIGMU
MATDFESSQQSSEEALSFLNPPTLVLDKSALLESTILFSTKQTPSSSSSSNLIVEFSLVLPGAETTETGFCVACLGSFTALLSGNRIYLCVSISCISDPPAINPPV